MPSSVIMRDTTIKIFGAVSRGVSSFPAKYILYKRDDERRYLIICIKCLYVHLISSRKKREKTLQYKETNGDLPNVMRRGNKEKQEFDVF